MLFLCYNWTTPFWLSPVPKTCTGAHASFVLLLSPAEPAPASAQKPIWPRHVVPHVPTHGSQMSKHSTSSSTGQAQSYLGQTVLNYSQSLSSAKWPDYRQLNLSFDAVLQHSWRAVLELTNISSCNRTLGGNWVLTICIIQLLLHSVPDHLKRLPNNLKYIYISFYLAVTTFKKGISLLSNPTNANGPVNGTKSNKKQSFLKLHFGQEWAIIGHGPAPFSSLEQSHMLAECVG